MELTPELKAKALSSGMMAKLKIAVTMARNARGPICLDEPLNGIDLLARDDIIASVIEAAEQDVSLEISSHLVDELERVADEAIFMKESHLVGRLRRGRASHDARQICGGLVTERFMDMEGNRNGKTDEI